MRGRRAHPLYRVWSRRAHARGDPVFFEFVAQFATASVAAIVLFAVAGLFNAAENCSTLASRPRGFVVAMQRCSDVGFKASCARDDRCRDRYGSTTAARLQPHIAFSGGSGTNRSRMSSEIPINESVPGMMIFRVEFKPALLQRGIRPRYGRRSSAPRN